MKDNFKTTVEASKRIFPGKTINKQQRRSNLGRRHANDDHDKESSSHLPFSWLTNEWTTTFLKCAIPGSMIFIFYPNQVNTGQTLY